MYGMFISRLHFFNSIDLSNFSTGNVMFFDYMFKGCKNLQYIDISYFSFGHDTYYNEFCTSLPSSGIIKLKII